MKLHDNPASPFCRKVRVLLIETGQARDVELAYAIGHPLAPERMPTAANPLGKIPALELADGTVLFDSRVICRYLDARPGGGLYPAEPRLWRVLTLEALADGMMEAAILMIYESRCRPEDIRFPDWVEAQWAKIARALDTLETDWQAHLAGPTDMGQIAVGCALGYLDFRLPGRDWRGAHPGLAAWFAAFAERPSMRETLPHG